MSHIFIYYIGTYSLAWKCSNSAGAFPENFGVFSPIHIFYYKVSGQGSKSGGARALAALAALASLAPMYILLNTLLLFGLIWAHSSSFELVWVRSGLLWLVQAHLGLFGLI